MRVFIYFASWTFFSLVATLLNIANIDWTLTGIVNGISIVIVLGILQTSLSEVVVQTLLALVIGGERRYNYKAPADKLNVILNYNLLATSKVEIDECFETMYEAYVGNLGPNVSAVLVSATSDGELKQYELELRDRYRRILYDDLFREGLAFIDGHIEQVDPLHLQHIWMLYKHVGKRVFICAFLDSICERYTQEFMVISRVSRVLRKCGQYQDLLILSEGESKSFTYCDTEYYGESARPYGEALFNESKDVVNIFGRKFDYTLVLDADTGVPRGGVAQLLHVAAANPDKGIIQPAIKLICKSSDTIFMHLEALRQDLYEPITNSVNALLGQSGYCGKALINNRLYIDTVIGSKENLVERVPIDVLSHDTFEAALLKPLYAGSVHLLEVPSFNYITWNIRERRWNRGEIILAMYFWKSAFGMPMRWIQKKLQKRKFIVTKLRTESQLDFVSSYIAHSALRQMFMKPALLLYILIQSYVHLHNTYAHIVMVMFIVIVLPKLAVVNRDNYKDVFLETVASILQFTPEAVVGCVRISRALYANMFMNAKWTPQRAVEEEFKNSNPFISSFKHLWGYSIFALITGTCVVLFFEQSMVILFMLITLLILPLFTGLSSHSPACLRRKRTRNVGCTNVSNVAIHSNAMKDVQLWSISNGNTCSSVGTLTDYVINNTGKKGLRSKNDKRLSLLKKRFSRLKRLYDLKNKIRATCMYKQFHIRNFYLLKSHT